VVALVIEDDGSGSTPQAGGGARPRLRLASMRERVEQVGGTFGVAYAPEPGPGWKSSPQERCVPHTPPTLRVLLVDDQPLFRKALAGLLNAQLDMTVVGEADSGLEALDRVRDLSPDIVVMDVNMPWRGAWTGSAPSGAPASPPRS